MITKAYTVAFEGVDARIVEVQCAVTAGLPAFSIVGLPGKSVSEAIERIRSALTAMAVALPSKRITVNLTPADLPKSGSHYDLPIALAVLAALEIVPAAEIEAFVAIGELALDGAIIPVNGAISAALAASSEDKDLLCPAGCAPEAAWVSSTQALGVTSLTSLVQHFTGNAVLPPAKPGEVASTEHVGDMIDVKGQERAKRALEIAASGRHHVLMVGPPGAGKSMLAARLTSILPEMTPREALETSMIHSVAGLLSGQGIRRDRPFRAPHHTASMPAIAGGGRGASPGEISLAHNGVLFMDEFPEYNRNVLETLRQPLETGEIAVTRANAKVTYPCRIMLVAAANPCRCGHLADANRACSRAPVCSEDYLGKISGPLMDRFDLRIELPPMAYSDLDLPASGETSFEIAKRVRAAREIQEARYEGLTAINQNADIEGKLLEDVATPDSESRAFLEQISDRFGLSARGYHRILRVARTIADLDQSEMVRKPHVAEAVSYRTSLSQQL
ncbi:YifB family Mg chelatase-like AAA ATPase [Halocynthiibacter sp. C4]|uniref:YifB family Mg chelatase-like AAA ATPase n=1 Tax=Halocynthiibacter sp. C4 TaxID=2992758 RepID=UPI00237B7C32|nr:YifB family Mg chelatase-like AAA ATPase [Halocynthiibacter sp. C4]MDE0590347.1 YifB family Mg chelatase-like AAA ATPase [Halocynthiibacter sp. C4]